MGDQRKGTLEEQLSPESIFNRLYLEYFPLIYSYSYRIVGNHEDARQSSQQVFTRFYEYLISGRAIREPRALIYRIATNLCYDHLRKKRRVQEAMKSEIAGDICNPDFDEEIEKKERAELVRNALLSLSPRDQRCLLLYQEGFSYAEISSLAKVKKSSVGKVLARATEKLARMIKNGEAS
jgi:RNA polymerase sigma-70 factor, ECF subfamily